MIATEISATLVGKRFLTSQIVEFTLRPDAEPARYTAALEPGSHLNVLTPAGATRSYSIVRATSDGSVTIAVKLERTGRGGSQSLIEATAVGDQIMISPAHNSFALKPAADYVFIAGGIGITGISALFRAALARHGATATLIYLSRSPEQAAYFTELTTGEHHNNVVSYHRRRSGGEPFDFWPLLEFPRDGERRVYCCGPEPLNERIRALTMHWRPSTVHFESFAGVHSLGALSEPFTVEWQPTGETVDVAADETMLAALNRSGIPTDSSCESGTCGTCTLTLVSGEAEHRDAVLAQTDHNHLVMPCVSRASSTRLVVGPVS